MGWAAGSLAPILEASRWPEFQKQVDASIQPSISNIWMPSSAPSNLPETGTRREDEIETPTGVIKAFCNLRGHLRVNCSTLFLAASCRRECVPGTPRPQPRRSTTQSASCNSSRRRDEATGASWVAPAGVQLDRALPS
jgi:hypothetical protein